MLKKTKLFFIIFNLIIINSVSISFAQTSTNNVIDELEEIVVTAQRREQNISDVSQAVQALSGDDLDELNITNFEEIKSSLAVFSLKNSGL